MAGMTTRYYSLTGGLNTSMGLGTINSSTRGTETPDCYNVESYKLSGLKSMEGNKQFANTLPSSITLGHEYRKESDKFMVVTTSDGSVWCYDKISNTFEKVYTFPNPSQRHSACNFNQGVVISNGIDDLVYYNRGRNTKLTGTVNVAPDSTAVTGTDTEFTKDIQVGDYIRFGTFKLPYKVEEIVSDTELLLAKPITEDVVGENYYAWTLDNQTYYTEDTELGGSKPYYTISDNQAEYVNSDGTIKEEGLVITSTEQKQVIIETSTPWVQPYEGYFTKWGTWTPTGGVYPNRDGYAITYNWGADDIQEFMKNVFVINGDEKTSNHVTWDFESPLKVNSMYFEVANLYNLEAPKSVLNIEILSKEGEVLYTNSWNAQKINSKVTVPVNKTIEGLVFNFTCNTASILMMGGLTLDAEIISTTTSYETITTTKTYARNTELDTTLANTLTDIKYYMSPISELNARLINSDDPTVDYEIRGLALNSYQGRLFVGGNDGNLYYSELGLIHGWDVKYGAGAIPPFYNDNSDFTALGIYGNYLIIHKRDYTYYLDGRNEPTSWEITPYADLSCDSQQSWVGANTGYYVFSRKAGGIYPLMSRTAFINNYLGKEISEKIRESFININSALYDQIYPVYHPSKKYLMFYMPMLQGNGGSNYCFIYDFISKAWWLRIVPQQVTGAFVFDGKVYITTKNGKVLQEFKTLTFDGDVINFSWRSPWFQYGDGTNYLSTREFRVKISEEYTNNFYVRNRRDGYEGYHQRNVTNDKETFEALEWSDNAGLITETVWDEYDWVETGYLIKRFPLPDQFFTSQQIEFYGSVKDEAMCILGFEVDRIEREENSW